MLVTVYYVCRCSSDDAEWKVISGPHNDFLDAVTNKTLLEREDPFHVFEVTAYELKLRRI